MKNIIFDLGRVVFARGIKHKCTEDFLNFFEFIRGDKMPEFWEEYDRGATTFEQVKETLCSLNNCSMEECDSYLRKAIVMQEAIPATEKLIEELKAYGYKLYVLSNMSREFIDFLRTMPVYKNFDGEVVSCDELVIKPEPRIYQIVLERYNLIPDQTLFIDDRAVNLEAAKKFGIDTHLFDFKNPKTTCEELRERLLK